MFKGVFLVAFFLLSSRNFQFLSEELVHQIEGVWICALTLVVLFKISSSFLAGKTSLEKTDVYALFVVLYFPTASAFMANLDWGQPLWYGFSAMRRFFLAFCPLLMLQLLRKKKISVNEIKKALLFLSWLQLFSFVYAALFQDSAAMQTTAAKGNLIKLPTFFLAVGFFYYANSSVAQIFLRKKILYAFYSLLYLAVIAVLFKGRILFFSVIAAWGAIFFMRRLSFEKKMVWVSVSLIFLMVIVSVLFLAFGPYLAQEISSFSAASAEAIKVVVTGQEASDGSANIRLREVSYMIQSTKHWLLGNGAIHYNWTGFKGSFPPWFFPSDIGWFGLIYLHGLIGLILLHWQFLLAWRWRRFEGTAAEEVFFSTCRAMVLFCFFYSMVTGLISVMPANTLIFVFLMQYMAKGRRSTDLRPA
jgi:hypothetical protein